LLQSERSYILSGLGFAPKYAFYFFEKAT